jgi:fumarate reductase subunit C
MSEERRSRSVSLPAFCVRLVSFICALVTAVIVLFVNPINWRGYTDFTKSDWVWLWLSNLAIVLLSAGAWWFGQRKLVRLIDGKKEPNQAPEPTAPSGRGSS